MDSSLLRKSLPNIALLGVWLVLVGLICLLPGKIPYETTREGGPVETLSAYGYFLFCLFLVHFNRIGAVKTSFAPAFFLLLLGLRELDFHARFTTMGMFKSRFFISPEVPLGEKVVVVCFIIFLIAYAAIYLRKTLPLFIRDLRAGEAYSVSVVFGLGAMVFSKFIDSNSEIFVFLAGAMENPKVMVRVAEECLEMFIPLFFIRALLQYCQAAGLRRSGGVSAAITGK